MCRVVIRWAAIVFKCARHKTVHCKDCAGALQICNRMQIDEFKRRSVKAITGVSGCPLASSAILPPASRRRWRWDYILVICLSLRAASCRPLGRIWTHQQPIVKNHFDNFIGMSWMIAI